MTKVIIKFGQKEHLKEVMKGKLFLGTPAIYSDFENNNSCGTGIKNLAEKIISLNPSGTVHVNGKEAKISDKPEDLKAIFCQSNEKHTHFPASNVRILFGGSEVNTAIYCTSIFEVNDNGVISFPVDPTIYSRSFNNHALVINKERLIDNITKYSKMQNYQLKHQPVNYIHNLNDNTTDLSNKTSQTFDLIWVLFNQHNSHEYQCEYRFAFLNKQIENYANISERYFHVDPIDEYSELVPVSELNRPIKNKEVYK